MDAVGIGMDMSWRVIVNNEFGLVAASASATPDTFDKWPSGKPKAHVEVSTIAIDKATMKITETISAPSDSSADQIARGECKAY